MHLLDRFLVSSRATLPILSHLVTTSIEGFDCVVKGLSALIHLCIWLCVEAYITVSSITKTTKIIEMFIKFDYIAKQND